MIIEIRGMEVVNADCCQREFSSEKSVFVGEGFGEGVM